MTIRQKAKRLAARGYMTFTFRDRTTDADSVYVARHPELPGCQARGETAGEAISNLAEVTVDYFEHLLEHGLPVSNPNEAYLPLTLTTG